MGPISSRVIQSYFKELVSYACEDTACWLIGISKSVAVV